MSSYLPKIGGAQVCAHYLANTLTRFGHNVTVYSSKNLVRACKDRGWRFNYTLEGIDPPLWILRHLPWPWRWIAKVIMARRVISDRLNVVQIISAWPWLPVAKEIKELTGVPVVLRCTGDDIQIDKSLGYGIRRDPKVRKLLEGGFLAVDRAIAISKTVTTEYIKAGIPKSRIVEVPPGIDVAAFESCKIDKSRVRKRWGIPADKRLIISVGRNHPKKGFKDLLRALAILNRSERRFMVCIVGRNSDDLLSEAESLGVEEDFFPIKELISMPEGGIGTLPPRELIELYKSSDYFVLPSIIEGFPLVNLEAMAAAIPVIVTDAPGCIDAVNDYEDGLIVPLNAPEKIAEKVLFLEENLELRDRIVQNGLSKAQNQNWDKIASEYLNIYKTVQKQ